MRVWVRLAGAHARVRACVCVGVCVGVGACVCVCVCACVCAYTYTYIQDVLVYCIHTFRYCLPSMNDKMLRQHLECECEYARGLPQLDNLVPAETAEALVVAEGI